MTTPPPAGQESARSGGANILLQALPYIQRFTGKVVVIKYGGNVLAGATDEEALAMFAHDVVLIHQAGLRPVVVHGGGPQISQMMDHRGKQPEFRNGLRITDAETVDIVRSVLLEQISPQIVAALNVHGPLAIGVDGESSGLIRATARDPELGFVGDVAAVEPAILHDLLAQALIPVVSPIGADSGGQVFNINADTAAGAIAEALAAEKLLYLTDIDGLRRVIANPASLIRQTTVDELDAMIADGTIADGMIPKAQSCAKALRGGVRRAHILDGRVPHVLLLELFTDEGIGTMIQ
ncbi:MAG: acetylglutamate kinase [Actinobacteria bacterium]|nr:acetylglutamate kinase [Actinomycetota bacterium]